jgi:hypothetical protein
MPREEVREMMGPGGHVQAHAQPALGTGMAGTVSLAMRTHLWISWARIALKHEAMAHAARQDMQQSGADQSGLLEREADAGLVGTCAAAFALEVISREMDELGMVPAAMRAVWRKNRLSDDKQILELVKLAVDPKGLVNVWKRELAWLFGVRAAPSTTGGPSRRRSSTRLERTSRHRRSPTRRRTPRGRSTCCWASWSGAGTSPSRRPTSGRRTCAALSTT